MEKEKQGEQEVELPKPTLIKDLGKMFPTEKSKVKVRYGLYECGFCGEEFKTVINSVKREGTKSCGCYRIKKVRERSTKHGLGYTRLYSIWKSMNMRVCNPQYKQYNEYGGSGITICEWKNDFMSFYNWAMSTGYSDELSIDRIDNDGDYSPENCRWVTKTIQCRNQRVYKNNKSGFKGVHLNKKRNKYVSCIKVNKKSIYLGSFLTAEEGAIAYNNYIIENSLEGFILNEIPERV